METERNQNPYKVDDPPHHDYSRSFPSTKLLAYLVFCLTHERTLTLGLHVRGYSSGIDGLAQDVLVLIFWQLPPSALKTVRLVCRSFRAASLAAITRLRADNDEALCNALPRQLNALTALTTLSIGPRSASWRQVFQTTPIPLNAGLNGLRELQFDAPLTDEGDAKRLAAALRCAPHLCGLGCSDERVVAALPGVRPGLRSLDIRLRTPRLNQDPRAMMAILELTCLQELRLLQAGDCSLLLASLSGLSSLRALAVSLHKEQNHRDLAALTQLTRLDVDLFYSARVPWSVGLSSLKALRCLKVQAPKIVGEAGRIIHGMKDLRELHLQLWGCVGPYSTASCPWGQACAPGLTKLILWSGDGPSPASQIMVAPLGGLRHLSLWMVDGTPAEMQTLAYHLIGLEHLDIQLKHSLCQYLLPHLSAATRLTSLRVLSCGGETLPSNVQATFLSSLVGLRELRLHWVLSAANGDENIR